MSSSPALPDSADLARQRAEDARYYREVLHKLIAMGTDLAGAIHRQATAGSAAPDQGQAREPAVAPVPNLAIPDPAIAFDRVARTIRRTILLARKLSEPDRAPGPVERPGERRLAAREHPVRGPEDATRRRTRDAEPLSPEFLDRLDAPERDDDFDEFGDDLDHQPLAGFIAGIRRDLARAVPPGAPIWKPRTSQDVWDLCVRAAQLTAAEPQAAEGSAQPAAPPPAAQPAPGAPRPASPQNANANTSISTGPPTRS